MGQVLLYGFTLASGSFAAWYEGPCSIVSSKVLSLIALTAVFFLLKYLQIKQEFRLLNVETDGSLGFFKTVLANSLPFFPLGYVFFTMLFMPDEWNGRAFFMLGGAALFLAAYSLFGFVFHMKICGFLTKPPEKLVRAIEDATRKTGIIPRKVFVLKSLYVNAYALPHLRSVVFTDRAVNHLDEDELYSIALHEYGHLMEPFYKWGTRFVPFLFLLPVIAYKPLATSHYFLWLGMVVLSFLVVLFVRLFSRQMEKKADAVANLHEDEEGLFARSLEKGYRLNLMPVVTGKRTSSHPDLYDRLLVSGAPPAYPRPKRPLRARFYVALTVFFVLPLVLLVLPKSYLMNQYQAYRGNEVFLHVLLAIDRSSYPLSDVALIEYDRGNREVALFFYQACTVLNGESVYCPANSALVLLALGRCSEAVKVYDEAQRRLQMVKEGGGLLDLESPELFLQNIKAPLQTCLEY